MSHPREVIEKFCELTGHKLTASYARQQVAAEFLARELTLDDLALVVKWTRAQIGKDRSVFSAASMQWRAMLGDLDTFEDRLNLARAAKPKPSAKPSLKPIAPANHERGKLGLREALEQRLKGDE